MCTINVINNGSNLNEFDYKIYESKETQMSFRLSDNNMKKKILTGVVIIGMSYYINSVPIIKSITPEKQSSVSEGKIINSGNNLDDMIISNNRTGIKNIVTTQEIQTYDITAGQSPMEIIIIGGVDMKKDIIDVEKCNQVNKYYRVFISGFIIGAITFLILGLINLSFFTPTLSIIGIIMSLGGALGFFVDKKIWEVKYKC